MDAGALLDLLGNENRRRILRLLSRKPCYVTEISEHLGVSPKAVIDHLRKLEEAGLIESRTDDQRRKYFHIARNVRLEVTVAPYGFATKSAYPASPSLDLSSCQHLKIKVSRRQVTSGGSAGSAEADGGATAVDVDAESVPDVVDGDEPGPPAAEFEIGPAEVTDLAEEIDELQDLERELSLAQRWVQGRIAGALESLADAVDDDRSYLHAEILATIAGGTTDPDEISRELDVPPDLIEQCLRRLRGQGILRRAAGEWQLAR
jgi:ArsR family transcriptional regulator